MFFSALPAIPVTLISSIVIVTLVIGEINAYLSPNVSEELFVDTTRGHKLKINLDFTIPRISCDCMCQSQLAW